MTCPCRLPRVLILSACLLAAVELRGQEAELVDRIVAIIDRDVVTLSEAERAKGVEALDRGGEPAELAEVVERLIEARLIEREVRRFTTEPPAEEEVSAQLAALRRSAERDGGYEAMLERRGLEERDLRIAIERQLVINRYLERRFRALTYVPDDDIRRYFEDEVQPRLDTPREPTEEEVERIRRILEERKFNERVDGWIEGLKERASIRRYVWRSSGS